MAVEFHEYLQACEISEFCATLQSSLANLTDNENKPLMGPTAENEKQIVQAVLLDGSSKEYLSGSFLTNESDKSANLSSSTNICQNNVEDSRSQQCPEQYLEQSKTFNKSSTNIYHKPVLPLENNGDDYGALSKQPTHNNNHIHIHDTRTVENNDKSSLPSAIFSVETSCGDISVSPIDPSNEEKTSEYAPSNSRRLVERVSDSNNTINKRSCNKVCSDVMQHSDRVTSCAKAEQKSGKFRQRQLSLPSGYSSSDTEHIVKEVRSRRRRNTCNVRFADEIGKMLSTFITIPSNDDQLFETYYSLSENYPDISRHILPTNNNEKPAVDYSWGSNNFSAIGEAMEKHNSSPAFFQNEEKRQSVPIFKLCFDQPSSNYDSFLQKLQVNGVCVETVQVYQHLAASGNDSEAEDLSAGPFYGEQFMCKILVKNIDACKSVVARCTTDNWLTFTEVSAEYVPQESEGPDVREYDTFKFMIAKPKPNNTDSPLRFNPINKIALRAVEFAVRYQAGGLTFWDNNNGRNYRILWR